MNHYTSRKSSNKINKKLKKILIQLVNNLTWIKFDIPDEIDFDKYDERVYYEDDENIVEVEHNLYKNIIDDIFEFSKINFENIDYIKSILIHVLFKITDKKSFFKILLILIEHYPMLIFRFVYWLEFFSKVFIFNKVLLNKAVISLINNVNSNELFINQSIHESHLSFGFYCRVKEYLMFFENQNQFDLDFLLNLSLIRGKYPGIFSPKFEEAFKYFKNKNGLDNHTECLNYIFKIDYNFLFLTKCFYLIKTTSKFDLFIKVFSGINFDHVKRLNKLVQYSFTRKELKTIKQFSNQYHFFINYYYTDNYITLFELNLLNKLS